MELLSGFLPSGQRHRIGVPRAFGDRALREVVCTMQVLQNPLPCSPCCTEPRQQGRQGGCGGPRAVPGLCAGWGASPSAVAPSSGGAGAGDAEVLSSSWTVCTFVQGGWAAFISPVVLEGPFRSSSSPRVLPGSKGARPGDSQSFGGSCQDSFQPLKTQRRWPQVGDIQ